MRRFVKSTLALFLAGVMAFAPAGEALAAGNIANDAVVVAETETEEVTVEESSEAETETTVEESNEAETETTVEESSEAETETTAEESSETETETVVEESSEAETETTVEESSEAETETTVEEETATEESSEIETVSETEEEMETEESPFAGIQDYALSTVEKENRRALNEQLPSIEGLVEDEDYVAGEVVFLADTQEAAEKIAAAYSGTLESWSYGVGIVILPANVTVTDALKAAAASADSTDGEALVLPPVWPNYIYTTMDEVADAQYTDEDSFKIAASNFNDPLLDPSSSYYQWQHAMVGSAYAWNAGYTGKGVTVAILDTGVYEHADLTNVIAHYDFTTDNDCVDGNGHGTHVAGLTAAKNNNGTGGAGIAPDASILDLKVLDAAGSETGEGDSASVLRGMRALEQGRSWTVAKADIVNMSLGGAFYSGNEAEVMKTLYEQGTAVFVAAGNDGSKSKAYPAAYNGAVCVGAVQQDGARAYFSNYGSWVKFSAPGSGLWSTANQNGGYVMMSGTSQATPVVSGTAAVILSADSNIQNQTGKARVDALVKKMQSGVIKGSNGASGIVSLPKALNLSTMAAAPKAPVFAAKSQTVKAKEFTVEIKSVSTTDTIYYSIDGKNPTYKNGTLSSNAIYYTGAFEVSGKAKITVKAIAVNACGKVSKVATATYTLKPQVESITISGQDKLVKGGSTKLTAAVYPSYAEKTKVKWESLDPTAVTVTNGKVTVKSSAEAGKTYSIYAIATDNSNVKSKEFQITVTDKAKVKTVAFKNENSKPVKTDAITIKKGENFASYEADKILKVDLAEGGEGTASDVNWTVDNTSVANVDALGKVTAISAGKVKVTAIANDGSGKSANFTLNVTKEADTLAILGLDQICNGKSAQMTLTYSPYYATSKTVDWSCDKDGVTVNNKGKVTVSAGAAAGDYKITAVVEGGATAEKVIKVVDNAITSIKFAEKTATIFRTAGTYNSPTSTVLNVTATGKAGNSTAYTFTSSNPGIATVDVDGKVTATGKTTGTTKITCTATDGSGKKAVCTVKVVNPTSKLSISASYQWIFGANAISQIGSDTMGYVAYGKNLKLTAKLGDDFGALSSKKIKWSSSNKDIATVSATGVVKIKNDASNAGKAVLITAEATDGSNAKTTYTVAIQDPIKRLQMFSNYLIGGMQEWKKGRLITSVKEGEGTYVYVKYNGKFYSELEEMIEYDCVSIEVSNPDVASVTWVGEGVFAVIGNKKGRTKITLKALDGTNTKVSYDLIVE